MDKYIFMILMDIPDEYEDEFNRLYDTDHLPNMMTVEGNLRCDRYRLDWSDNADMQRYLAVYDITDPELPRSNAWKAQAGLGEWPKDMRHHILNRGNGVFRELSSHRAETSQNDQSLSRECIYFLQQGIPSELEDRFNLLYDTDHIPHMMEAPSARGCRRFKLEWTATENVPDYLAIYNITTPDIPRSPAWKTQTGKGAWPTEMRPNFTARRNGAYSRISVHPGG